MFGVQDLTGTDGLMNARGTNMDYVARSGECGNILSNGTLKLIVCFKYDRSIVAER